MESKTDRFRRGGDVRASRSKGCLTCRRRKVRCDERRPTCERCEKGARECLGYDKPLIFVHHGPQSDHSLGTTSTHSHYSSKSVASQGTPNATPAASDSSSSPASYNPAPGDVGHACAALDLSGFKDSIVIAHLIARFAFGYGDARPHGADAPTMVAILTSGNSESSAYVSGLGLAHAFFGRIHNDDEMVKGSVQLYGKALSSLRRDLQPANQEAARSRAYMNLWTSIMLGMYEMVSSVSPSNWLQHSSGVSALTQMAGPEAFQSDSANAMLELYRSFMVVGNIVHRKRCFLELPEWKSVPWQNRQKSVSSQLCDVLCDIPGLMEDVDRVLASEELGTDMSVDRVAVQNKILDSIDELATLRWLWEASYPMACWERPINPQRSISVDEYGQPLFGSCLEYETVNRAIDIIHADAVRLLLYTLSDQIGLPDALLMSSLERNQRHGPGSTPLVLPGMGDRFANAMEICRSVEYLLEESRDSIGIFVLLFPMRVAFTHLQRVPKMAAWIQKILGSSTSKGFELGEHVLKMGKVGSIAS